LIRLVAPSALALLLLAGCSDESAPAENGAGVPPGEVLEGSISDEMIPYDRLRSQPPRAAPLPGEGGSGARPGAAPDGATPAAGEAADEAATGDAAPAVQLPPPLDLPAPDE
jgi:hypothetical protein